jgi:hypothetical protein
MGIAANPRGAHQVGRVFAGQIVEEACQRASSVPRWHAQGGPDALWTSQCVTASTPNCRFAGRVAIDRGTQFGYICPQYGYKQKSF